MRRRNEKGEVVVEATIIVTLVVMLITLMLYVGMILYQKTLISVMANQTASNIAQVYSNNLKDPFTGYVDPDKVYQSITYSNLKTDAYMDVLNQKANVLGQYRLKSSRILTTGATTVDVEIVKKPNELLKSQIVVTIHDKYDIPLVNMFGINSGLVEFSATGRADCVDVLEYINGVEAIGDPDSSPIPSLPDSDTCLVTFVVDKYTGGFHAAVPVLRGKSILSSNHFSHCEMPENPQYGDLKFNGWVLEDGTPFNASRLIEEDITVYGAWLCQITFSPEGGKVDPKSKKVEYKKPTDLPTPTRNGYAFEGWYTQKNGGGEQYYSNVTEITGNITLYAKWKCLHVKYNTKLLREGHCKQRSLWEYKCQTCPYTWQKEGNYGGHQMGGEQVLSNPWCTSKGSKGHRCSKCGYTQETGKIAALGHDMNGRCGKTHNLGDGYKIPSHRGAKYVSTTKGECIVCTRCAAPYQEQWVIRNNQWVAKGMYCREHKWTNGKKYSDGSQYDGLPIIQVQHP